MNTDSKPAGQDAPKAQRNVGAKTRIIVVPAKHPDTDQIAKESAAARQEKSLVDVLLVNPPTPDGGIWIRSQHRVGRRSRENMIWPQVSLAQLAAMLHPTYSVRVIDAVAERMSWATFEQILRKERPRYYVTQLTAPTLQNDMYGTFLAKSVGADDAGVRHAHHADAARDACGRFPRSTTGCAASQTSPCVT